MNRNKAGHFRWSLFLNFKQTISAPFERFWLEYAQKISIVSGGGGGVVVGDKNVSEPKWVSKVKNFDREGREGVGWDISPILPAFSPTNHLSFGCW